MEKEIITGIVLSAAQEVFSTMLGMESEPAGDAIETPEDQGEQEQERVVALIGLAGNHIGNGLIGCSVKFACQAASTMLMAEYDAVNGDVLDAMGEIANMIFGNVKTALEAQLGALGLSIPTVVFGRNFSTRSIGSQAWVKVPMVVAGEQIDLRFCIAPNSAVMRQSKHGFKREYALAEV